MVMLNLSSSVFFLIFLIVFGFTIKVYSLIARLKVGFINLFLWFSITFMNLAHMNLDVLSIYLSCDYLLNFFIYLIKLFAHVYIFVCIYVSYSWPNG